MASRRNDRNRQEKIREVREEMEILSYFRGTDRGRGFDSVNNWGFR